MLIGTPIKFKDLQQITKSASNGAASALRRAPKRDGMDNEQYMYFCKRQKRVVEILARQGLTLLFDQTFSVKTDKE